MQHDLIYKTDSLKTIILLQYGAANSVCEFEYTNNISYTIGIIVYIVWRFENMALFFS